MATAAILQKHLSLAILCLCLVPAFCQGGIIYDECPESHDFFCLNGGTCTRLPGLPLDQAVKCNCPTGMIGQRCEESIVDPEAATGPRGGEIRPVYIVVGVLGGLLLIATVVAVVYFCRRKEHGDESEGEQMQNGGETSKDKAITTIV